MSEDITRIRIGKSQVGVTGLRNVLEELAQSQPELSDDQVRSILLDRLSGINYIPDSARDEYGEAFIREFRKFLGQPHNEPVEGELAIHVLGPGCPNCERLEQTVMQALTELNLQASLEHVTDVKEITAFGVMGAPALIVNGKVVCVGRIPPVNKIKEWLLKTE